MSVSATYDVRGFIADLDCAASDPAAVHRLTIALARTAGLPDVSRVILRYVASALRASGAAMAVPGPAVPFSIIATYGAPQRATAALRSAVDAQGQTDGTLQSDLGIGRVLLQEINAGGQVLGVVCIADRLDSQPFTRADAAALRALTAPAALALEREALRRHAAVFARAAAIDPVSGLYNRRHFHARLKEELQRAERSDGTVALLMIDLDDFKRVNDSYGHAAGDATIRAAATIIRRSVRPFDICTRYGGEEFAVVMPESSSSTAETVAERIRTRIGAWAPAEPTLAGLHITASIGYALGHRTTSTDEFLARADQALYAAKKAGKNQVRAAS